ncbi:hypothetical protein AURDEDRAFT_177187, partial [Auricularia subglabra TFB-10046 SS5]
MSIPRKLRALSSFFSRRKLFRRQKGRRATQGATSGEVEHASATSSRVDELEAGLRAVGDASAITPATVDSGLYPSARAVPGERFGVIASDRAGELGGGDAQGPHDGEPDLVKNGACGQGSGSTNGHAVVAGVANGVFKSISGEELTASRELELYDPFDACEMHIAPDAGNRFEDRISRGCGEPLVSRSSSGEELDPGKEHGEREESAAGDGGPRPVPTAAEVFVRNMVDNYAVEWVFVVSQA